MVALIQIGDVDELLEHRSLIDQTRRISVAWRRDRWSGAKPHLALLLDEDQHISWLARASGGPAITSLDRRINISEIHDFESLSLDELHENLPTHVRFRLVPGILSVGTGNQVVRTLRTLRPEWSELISTLERPDDQIFPTDSRGRVLNEQRDAVGLILEFGGLGREPLRGAVTPTEGPSFLRGMNERDVSEETIANYDISRFPGMTESYGAEVDWRIFQANGRRMFVMNANTEPLENTTGADLIYYNEHYASFVLVQYKRLSRSSAETGAGKFYRPDNNLSSELERLRAVDAMCTSSEGGFRLHDRASWIKLCDSGSRVSNPTELITGMYLARDYFEELLEESKGPRGGTRLGYDTVPRYITNTNFIDLVRDGWIGTRGTTTTTLAEIVVKVLESRRSLVLGASLDSDQSRSRRRRR